jgi:CheY-like chemotaxis protein
VVLLDLQLPVMDGLAFCAEAERQHVLAGIPIVVTSASRNVLRDAQNLGAAALAKPFDLDELILTIEDLVDPESAPRPAVNSYLPR